ncbi:MAG: monovalent cation/H+ antiporter complex subunit F [Desulfobacterales bacterium]|nr:monovalent cation/H+ antiporter complex subunit F [Desulfobacterales bacterium]
MILQATINLIVFPLLSLTLLLGFIRLFLGPTLPDRIIAFELMSITAAGIIVVSAITADQPVLLDVASGWAIISFLSVIAFSFYIEKWRGRP